MTPRRLLATAAAYWRPDAFEIQAARSIGGGKPAGFVDLSTCRFTFDIVKRIA